MKTWDDPAIKKLNPNVKLPSQAIAVVPPLRRFRHDLQLHLLSVESQRRLEIASRFRDLGRMAGGIGAKGNEGVSNNVSQTKGSIGYVEYAYALQNKMVYTKMVNKDGKTVSPTSDAFQAAAANADWNSVPGYGVILTNQPGAASWPMTAATFILIPKQPQDPVAAAEALKFFAWAYAKGDKMAEELDYVPMPKKVVDEIEKVWASEIKDADGKPLHVSAWRISGDSVAAVAGPRRFCRPVARVLCGGRYIV